MDSSEKVVYTNVFGTVTNKRIVLKYKSGSEDILISQISSISLQHKRNYFSAITSLVLGLIIISYMLLMINSLGGLEIIFILLFCGVAFLSSLANWVGHHNIIISTSGQNRKPLKVEMAKTKEGLQFVIEAKKAIFS